VWGGRAGNGAAKSGTTSLGRGLMKVPLGLIEDIAKAMGRLSRPGIEGWGLKVFGGMEAAGDLMDITEHMGCTSDTCAHKSHDPAAPERRWVPRNGRLVEIGSDVEPGEVIVRWFAHIGDDGVRYIRVEEPRFFHATASYVSTVPEWVLVRLIEEAAV